MIYIKPVNSTMYIKYNKIFVEYPTRMPNLNVGEKRKYDVWMVDVELA